MTVDEVRKAVKENFKRLHGESQSRNIEEYSMFLGLCWRDFERMKAKYKRLVLTVAMCEAITSYDYSQLSGRYLLETCELFKQFLSRLFVNKDIHYTIHAVDKTVKFYY